MKETLAKIVKIVCDYLRVNENLFFASKRATRVLDAKKYVAHIAFNVEKMPPSVIAKYMGVFEARSSIVKEWAQTVQKAIWYDQSSQTALDIEAIRKICEKKI